MNKHTQSIDDYHQEHYKVLSYIHFAVVLYFLGALCLSQFQMHLFPYIGSLPHLQVPGGYLSQAAILIVVTFLLLASVNQFNKFNRGHHSGRLVFGFFIFILVAAIMWRMMRINLSILTWGSLILSTVAITYFGSKVKPRPIKVNPEPKNVVDHQRVPMRSTVLNEASAQTKTEEDIPIQYEAIFTDKSFKNIIGMTSTKERLLNAGNDILNALSVKAKAKRNGILLSGEPGNGKTFFVECFAGELNLPLIAVTYGDVASKWINQTTENVMKVFKDAYAQAPCVLFLDEIDSFIKSRDGLNQNDESKKITNTILTEISNLRDRGVILVGATNYLESLDNAAIREGRFDMKIEVPPPDEAARYSVLIESIVANLPDTELNMDSVERMAKRWVGFSVKRIQAVGEELAVMDDEEDIYSIDSELLGRALRRIQGRKGKLPENTKTFDQLYFDAKLESQIKGIATRMNSAEKVEELGGTVPSGLLFFGPSGTGKTETVRALAKETNYAFISYTGNELINDPDSIDRMMKEAKDIRPCIVFIDEADDILANRAYSNSASVTNKLLIAMDGSDGKVKDIIFIAATNHPDNIDAAALRGGRFTEKLFFDYPSQNTLARFIDSWIKSSSAKFEASLTPQFLASSIGEKVSIANAAYIMQEAVNQMIVRCAAFNKYEVSEVDIHVAKGIIFGQN